MECLYKEDVDRIFTLDEPFEEMGSEAIEVPALKEEEFAQITVLGLCVSFPNEAQEFTFESQKLLKVLLSLSPIGLWMRGGLSFKTNALKTFQSKNKGLVSETFDWDEEEVSDDEETTELKVLMALADDELTVERIMPAMQILNQKKKILGGELLTDSSSKIEVKENLFIPASLDYDHEMVPKSKDWIERHNPDSKLPNFNTRRILVLVSQAVNGCLKLTEATTNPESSKESGSGPQIPLPPLKNLQLQALRKCH
ncbi:hypothetical protein Tco_1191684 [Tanacetum coccineum]